MNSPPMTPMQLSSSSNESLDQQGSKRKLSASDVDVDCTSCSLLAKKPISCIGCYNYFCDNCINLPERKCLRCETDSSPGATPKCQVHDKEMNFFCLTCEKETCAECILDVKDHKRHTFDRLDAVYLEKIAVTNEKIAEIELRIETLEKHTQEAEKNLALIKVTEDSIMAELQTLFDAAKGEISETVQGKREELEKRIQLPAERKALVKQLQDQIEAIGHFKFIKQQERFNTECDKLQEQCKEFSTDFIDHYDIGW